MKKRQNITIQNILKEVQDLIIAIKQTLKNKERITKKS